MHSINSWPQLLIALNLIKLQTIYRGRKREGEKGADKEREPERERERQTEIFRRREKE